MHKAKTKEIIEANLKKTYEKITEEARQEKEKNSSRLDQLHLSAVTLRPVKPYLQLIPLKDYAYF